MSEVSVTFESHGHPVVALERAEREARARKMRDRALAEPGRR